MVLGERAWDISRGDFADGLWGDICGGCSGRVLGLASQELSDWLHVRLYRFRGIGRELGLALGNMEVDDV